MGNSLLQLGRYDEAAAQYSEALRLDPGLQAAQQNRDRALQLRGGGR